MKTSHILAALLAVLLSATPIGAQTTMTDSDVVVSIKPLHSIVANITKGIATPVLILSTPSSPHTHTLKPSNALAIAKAKVIVWIGPQVETFLQKPIATLNHKALVISFPQSSPNTDPHVWLDPVRVKAMAKNIATALITTDPANTVTYQANLQSTLIRLDALDETLASQLANTKPIVVYHNAYSHLAKRYKLKIAGVLVNNPELKPGAKRISQIRQILKTTTISCIFSEPEFDNKTITSLFADTQVKTGILDPLGSNIKAGPDHYFKMMRQLANNVKNCN